MRPGPVALELPAECAGQRVDVAVVAALRGAGHAVTRSALARAFAAGGVRGPDGALKPSRVISQALSVTVALVAAPALSARPEPMDLHIIHEDEDVLVVNKPAGVVVHPAPGHETGTLVSGVLHHVQHTMPVLPGNDATRPGVVHRIDQFTSGLLVFTKNERAQEVLAAQFRDHSIDRRYLGVVVGEPSFDEQRVETAHGRDPADRRRFQTQSGPRRAVTHAKVVERMGAASVMSFELETGRTHQIRLHARHLGHPIVGDALYGYRARGPLRAAMGDLARHALHAETLGFEHPAGGRVSFEAPLAAELVALVQRLRAAT